MSIVLFLNKITYKYVIYFYSAKCVFAHAKIAAIEYFIQIFSIVFMHEWAFFSLKS